MCKILMPGRLFILALLLFFLSMPISLTMEVKGASVDGLPMMIMDHTPRDPMTGEPFKFQVELYDEDGIDQARVIYWFGPDDPVNQSLTGSGNNWSWSIIIPHTSYNLNYEFIFSDTIGNWNGTMWRSLPVKDNQPPILEDDLTPKSAFTGDDLLLNFDVSDNVAIQVVYLEYWYGEGAHNNVSMTGGDGYTYTLNIPDDSLDTLHYIVGAVDTTGLAFRSGISDVDIQDDDPPVLKGGLSITRVVGCGENCTVSAVVSDNIEIESVKMEYWFTGGAVQEVEMTALGSTYTYSIWITPDCTFDLELEIIAVDTSGNNFRSNTEFVDIVDRTPPVMEPIPDLTVNVSEPFSITVIATDNIGIYSVVWENSPIDSDDLTLSGSLDQEGFHKIEVTVSDDAGNSVSKTFNLAVIPGGMDEETDNGSDSESILTVLLIIGLLMLVIGGVVGFLLYKKKKDNELVDEEKEEDREEEKPKEEEKTLYETFTDVPLSVDEAHRNDHMEHKELSYEELYGKPPAVAGSEETPSSGEARKEGTDNTGQKAKELAPQEKTEEVGQAPSENVDSTPAGENGPDTPVP